MKLFTIGFTKKTAEGFFDLLRRSGTKKIVDVRLNNVSQLAGFAKKDDLAWFLRELCGVDYVHLPKLAPTQEMLDRYRKERVGWPAYETEFLRLMAQRKIEKEIAREQLSGACLLCSEDEPHHCHRRLVADYLGKHWGNVEVVHLGSREAASRGSRKSG